jgi:hypothetical protein
VAILARCDYGETVWLMAQYSTIQGKFQWFAYKNARFRIFEKLKEEKAGLKRENLGK